MKPDLAMKKWYLMLDFKFSGRDVLFNGETFSPGDGKLIHFLNPDSL
jgi:hypothetical protein